MKTSISILVLIVTIAGLSLLARAAETIAPIPRRLPPPDGIVLPAKQEKQLQQDLAAVQKRMAALKNHPSRPDVEIYTKAVRYALLHNEFYNKNEIARAFDALQRANARLDELDKGKTPWTRQKGLLVRGYRSSIDGSVQPYGLEIPDSVDFNKRVPLYVWLHGRGDKSTDLHFIHRQQTRAGRIAPAGAIVLHPFGRQCVGYKSAGEIDVLELVEHIKQQYNIDADRIVLMGFSMGGAGCWHIGAHYADRWVAMSPGAGFTETARYNNIKPADYPPTYEQALWGLYDVPGYTRNLFNLPVVVYSGELDKQIQAARMMEAAFESHGRKMPHLIGPGMGHRYHPETLEQLMKQMEAFAAKGINRRPQKISLQTQTLRYNRVHWVEVQGLKQHWQDSRVDAEIVGKNKLRISTKNVTELSLSPWKEMAGTEITIDGKQITMPKSSGSFSTATLVYQNGWINKFFVSPYLIEHLKSPGLQGPIDDVLMAPFLVVTPSGKSKHAQVQRWVEFEQQHFIDRWRALMRGEARVKKDSEVTEADIAKYNLILWGDADSNSLIAKTLPDLPLKWNAENLTIAGKTYPAASHVPMLIYPNPLNPNPLNPVKYVVLNSGMTHREGHDRTNSLQNPKLPDWAVIDLSQPPNNLSPGRIAAADFFDEQWKVKQK